MSGISAISSTYTPILLSHQTGLYITSSSQNKGYAIGTSISIPRNGIVKITVIGHIENQSATYEGFIYLAITRGSNTYYLGGANISQSLFSNYGNNGITNTSPLFLNYNISNNPSSTIAGNSSNPFTLEIPLLEGDILQFYAGTNYNATTNIYIDDLVVIIQ